MWKGAGAMRRIKVEKNKETLVRSSDSDVRLHCDEEDIRGWGVVDSGGSEIGEMKDLLIDEHDMRIRFIEVASGVFFRLGERTFLIPIDTIMSVKS